MPFLSTTTFEAAFPSLGKVAFFILLVLTSCQSVPSSQDVEKDAQALAALYCRAQDLREERFKLADDIRFLEDSIATFPDAPETTTRKQTLIDLQGTTDDMWLRTKKLADSIDNLLSDFYKEKYPEKEDRSRLDEALMQVINSECPPTSSQDTLR